MSSLKIGYVPLAKASWRDQRLEVVREQSLSLLQGLNPAYSVVGGEDLITTDAEALALLERFEKERVDVILLHFITFALGSIVPLLAERSKLPLVLWSMPEPPMEGGRISYSRQARIVSVGRKMRSCGKGRRSTWPSLR